MIHPAVPFGEAEQKQQMVWSHEAFRSFLDAEVAAILESMDKCDRADVRRCDAKALEWIQQHAENFRKAWNANHRRRAGRRQQSQRRHERGSILMRNLTNACTYKMSIVVGARADIKYAEKAIP